MAGSRLFIASVAVLVVVAIAVVAYRPERTDDGGGPEAARGPDGRLAALEAIEDRLARLEEKVASLPGALAAGRESTRAEAAREGDRLAALETTLSAVQLRVKGLEEDPLHRGEAFIESENAEMRREGINALRRVARFDPKTRASIRALLQDPSNRVREQAAQVLRDLRDKESAPEIKALLADPDAMTRRRAVEALGAMGASDAAGEIGRNLLTDADDRVRFAAADALGKLKAQEAAGPLTEALKDRSDLVRGEAIASLGEVGASAAAPQLRAIYDQDPGNHRIRLAIALRSLGDEAPLQKEVARLSEILKLETDQRLRQQAQRELTLLTRSSAP